MPETEEFKKIAGIGMATIWKMRTLRDSGDYHWRGRSNKMPLLIKHGLARHNAARLAEGHTSAYELTPEGEEYLDAALIDFYRRQGVSRPTGKPQAVRDVE